MPYNKSLQTDRGPFCGSVTFSSASSAAAELHRSPAQVYAMDYMELLRRYDDPKNWAYPPAFDYNATTTRFARCAEALSKALGLSLRSETGSYIQDASFHSQIFVPGGEKRYAMIRFSNFGDMVSVGTCYFGEMAPEGADDPIPPALLKVIVLVLEKEGYVYVPAEFLMQPYTGKNPGVTGIRDWWIRYFDWV